MLIKDIAWDELDQIDDHIVPHPSNEHENEQVYQEDDNYKKLRHEVIGISSDLITIHYMIFLMTCSNFGQNWYCFCIYIKNIIEAGKDPT